MKMASQLQLLRQRKKNVVSSLKGLRNETEQSQIEIIRLNVLKTEIMDECLMAKSQILKNAPKL